MGSACGSGNKKVVADTNEQVVADTVEKKEQVVVDNTAQQDASIPEPVKPHNAVPMNSEVVEIGTAVHEEPGPQVEQDKVKMTAGAPLSDSLPEQVMTAGEASKDTAQLSESEKNDSAQDQSTTEAVPQGELELMSQPQEGSMETVPAAEAQPPAEMAPEVDARPLVPIDAPVVETVPDAKFQQSVETASDVVAGSQEASDTPVAESLPAAESQQPAVISPEVVTGPQDSVAIVQAAEADHSAGA